MSGARCKHALSALRQGASVDTVLSEYAVAAAFEQFRHTKVLAE